MTLREILTDYTGMLETLATEDGIHDRQVDMEEVRLISGIIDEILFQNQVLLRHLTIELHQKGAEYDKLRERVEDFIMVHL